MFFGTAEFAVPSLEQLVACRHAVVMCVTQPDRPQGRGLAPAPSPVKRAALQFGLPLAQPERVERSGFASLAADVGVTVSYGQLIRQDLLALPRYGMLGVHPSLLPKYRGAAPVAWTILQGDTATGVTIFRLNERLDAGDILLQEASPITPGDDAEALSKLLAGQGAALLVRGLDLLASGRAQWRPQDESHASLAPKLTKAQGHVDWRATAQELERLVRATVPWPGAVTAWHGQPLKILAASVGRAEDGVPPGTVVAVGETVAVATGQGTLEITDVQPAGKRRMTIKEFLAGHPISVGERLGGDIT